MANNMTAELVTWRADGEETGFDYDPTLENLQEFLGCVNWDGKPHVYQLVYSGEKLLPNVYGWKTWLLNGMPIELKGVTVVAEAEEGAPDSEGVVYCNPGDGIQITITCSEVQVTDERNRPAGNYHDAVVDGVLYRGIPDRVIFVEDENDLDDLTDEQPGTVAMTYDEASKWRYDGADWTEVGGASGGAE